MNQAYGLHQRDNDKLLATLKKLRDLGNTFTDGAARVRDNGNDGYDATRTATARTANDNTFLGMNSTTWTWFVLAIAAIAIVGLVWYYAMQTKNEYNNHND